MFGQNVGIFFLLATFILGLPAFAHEGHGHTPGEGTAPSHYLSEPFHLLQFAAIASVIFAVGWVAMKWYFSKGSNQAIKVD